MMRGFGMICLILVLAIVAAAQDTPRMETFLGYTYVRANSANKIPSFSSNGGSGQYVYNFNTWLGAVADLGAVHNGNIGGHLIDNTAANFLFGPRISFRYPRIRPYFQVLFGGVYFTASSRVDVVLANPSQPIYLPGQGTILLPGGAITARAVSAQTAFAMTAGGGLDIKVNKHLSLRPIGLDYYMTRLENLRTQGDNSQNNLRYTAGLNFTFGGAR
jgi:hypothetical protein